MRSSAFEVAASVQTEVTARTIQSRWIRECGIERSPVRVSGCLEKRKVGFPKMAICSRESVYFPGETTFAFWKSTIRVSDLDAIFP